MIKYYENIIPSDHAYTDFIITKTDECILIDESNTLLSIKSNTKMHPSEIYLSNGKFIMEFTSETSFAINYLQTEEVYISPKNYVFDSSSFKYDVEYFTGRCEETVKNITQCFVFDFNVFDIFFFDVKVAEIYASNKNFTCGKFTCGNLFIENRGETFITSGTYIDFSYTKDIAGIDTDYKGDICMWYIQDGKMKVVTPIGTIIESWDLPNINLYEFDFIKLREMDGLICIITFNCCYIFNKRNLELILCLNIDGNNTISSNELLRINFSIWKSRFFSIGEYLGYCNNNNLTLYDMDGNKYRSMFIGFRNNFGLKSHKEYKLKSCVYQHIGKEEYFMFNFMNDKTKKYIVNIFKQT